MEIHRRYDMVAMPSNTIPLVGVKTIALVYLPKLLSCIFLFYVLNMECSKTWGEVITRHR